MKASELIELLRANVAQYGDLPVCLTGYQGPVRIDRAVSGVDCTCCFAVIGARYPSEQPHFAVKH